jgi:DNA-binding transcriptional MerR regulator
MIAGVPFNLYAGLFTPNKLAELCGVKRPVIDTMSNRGFIGPTQRERATKRPLFSFRDADYIRMMRVVAPLGLGLKESSLMADEFKRKKMTKSEVAMEAMAEMAAIAETPTTKGEWMWAMARSVERGKPFYIYAYAAPIKNKWQFDMHIENPGVEHPGEPPCFGWEVPHIYVPVSEIFIAVYDDCKRMLALSDQTTESEDA